MFRIGLTVLVLASCLGCGKPSASSGPRDSVTHVAETDPKMNAAIDKARETVDTFTAAVQAPKPGQSAFAVKVPFVDGKATEHMWVTDVTFDGTNFHGTVSNDPEMVKNVHNGQKVSTEKLKISDWMFVEDSKLVGGYTLRVLREGLSPSERAAFDKSVPFVIE